VFGPPGGLLKIQGRQEMTSKIFYKSGYKYQLQADYSILSGITGYNAGNAFCHLFPDGQLDIHAGYAWDGPSSIAIDTPSFMRGSLVHDALYQLIREVYLPYEWREKVDGLLYEICREDGMNWWRAKSVLATVRLFGKTSADPAHTKPILEAP